MQLACEAWRAEPGAAEMMRELEADARDLAENFARSHRSDRMRIRALEAKAGVLGLAELDELWRRAEGSGSRLVALEARRKRVTFELV